MCVCVCYTNRGVLYVILQRVDEQVPYRLPCCAGVLCVCQSQLQRIHATLQLLHALQDALHAALPPARGRTHTLPAVTHLAALLTHCARQKGRTLLWSQV